MDSIAALLAAFVTATATGLVVWASMVMNQIDDELSAFVHQQR